MGKMALPALPALLALRVAMASLAAEAAFDPEAPDLSCSLQKRATLTLEAAEEEAEERALGSPLGDVGNGAEDLSASASAWSTPGVRFRGRCSASASRAPFFGKPKASLVGTVGTQLLSSRTLPEKATCPPGQMAIGDFSETSYSFSCCAAGIHCGGCRKVVEGRCTECAAGYVRQEIPILNVSMCFLCDDVPGWQDALNCRDYESLGYCSSHDEAFRGLSASEACCACGGGSVHATPTRVPLMGKSLYFGQSIDAFPEPRAFSTQVGACNLAESGLQITGSGEVSGKVSSSSQLKCSVMLTQDPMRGIFSPVSLNIPVSNFSYGDQVLAFKYWGLDTIPSTGGFPVQSRQRWENFQLSCNPSCPWLELRTDGTLLSKYSGFGEHADMAMPTLSRFGGMPSCSCQVSARAALLPAPTPTASTSFLTVQARMWKAGAYEVSSVQARNGVPLHPSRLQEQVEGLRWYDGEGESWKLPVLENTSSGDRFVVSPSLPPELLDVQCRDGDGKAATYAWSRLTGDLTRDGFVAFNLDPRTGLVSGTPRLDLSKEGRGSLEIHCSMALGGSLYDKVLPVAQITVHVVDDMCWVPAQVSGHFRWKQFSSNSSCLAQCRERADCAAVREASSGCHAMVSDGESEAFQGSVLLRLENCSEEDTGLNLTCKGARYLQGVLEPSNDYKDQVSYSRAGLTPQLQLHLVHRSFAEIQLPKSCDASSWLLVHANVSDFQNGSMEAPEYFGAAAACIDKDVLAGAFSNGSEKFDLRLLPSELDDIFILEKPKALQPAELSLAMPTCEQPSAGFVVGSVEDSEHFSLDPCECFGEQHARTSPVTESSNAAVPRVGPFNNGSVKDQLISSGPYTCEHISHIRHFAAATLASCATACNSNSNCSFYQLGVASETCTLFRRCDYLQQIDLQLVNKLYGVAPKGDFCRIADPDQCWTKIKRRSYLSLSPSSVPRCLFQAQYDACDALQQISGEQAGQCQRCQYLESNSSYAAKGISKVPLPEDFPSGSQVSIGCNYTGRLFSRLENGLTWDGPRPSAVFTCVSGKWVGEPGAWQHLENLTCLQCIQLGTPSLWRLTEITLPEVYFLEHRQIQVTHATTAGPGCSTASKQTASPLKVQVQAEVWVDVCISKTEIALSACGDIPSFYQDLQLRLHVTGASDECLKYQQGKLAMCNCLDPGALRLERQHLRLGSKCVFASDIQKDPAAFQMVDCDALGPRQLWSFSSGNCIFGMDMVDTADRAWNFSVAVQGDDSELQLVQMKFAPERQSEPVLPAYSLGQSNAFLSTCLTMQDGKLVIAEAPCKGGFVVEEFQSGTTIAYYPDPKLQEDPYYLYDNDGTVGLLPTTATLPSTAFWNIQPDNGGTVKLKNVHTSKCAASTGQALKVNDARWAPVSNNFQYDCKRSFVTGLSSKKDAGNYKLCGDWDDAKGTFKGMSLRGENCHNFSRTLTESESKVTINCPQGTYLIDDPGNNDNSLPNHGHDFKKGEQLWWECCDMSLPPYVWFDNQHTYELKATLTDDDHSWNYSCALGNDKDDDDGLNKYTGSFMTSFTWTSHEPDSSVGCVSGLHSLSPSGDVSLQACDDASRSSAFVDWAMDPLTPKSSTEASPASPALPEELSSCQACQASLFVDLNESIFHKTGGISEATDLSLTVESLPELSVQQRQGYQYVHQLFVLEKTGKKEEVLFACQQQQGARSRLCADQASVSPSDLQGAYATGSNLTVEKVCPLLMSMSSMEKLPRSVEPVSGLKGLTMKSFSDIMMDQAYTSIAFGSPQKWPFLFNGAGDERADAVGFLSVPKNGDTFWGLSCPPQAVVVSEPQTLPHCLHIGASEDEMNFTSFSGSAACPAGAAVSGWYNLPGIPVKKGEKGGPATWTGLQVFCRKTSLLAACAQPEKSHCEVGHVVNAFSYSGNQFKLGCCRLQKPMGTKLTPDPRKARQYEGFEGYYCPAAMGSTGMAVYIKSRIGPLGEPGTSTDLNWTLSWEKFDGTWVLRHAGEKYASVESDAVSPLEIEGNAKFSATKIEALLSEAAKPKVQSPFPKKKPTYPKLIQFRPVQPDYKAYCNPTFLQNPSLFKGSISDTNPCYHTFHADLVKGVSEKGITEKSFWSCADRGNARQYLSSMAEYSTGKAKAEAAETMKKIEIAETTASLAAAVIGAIPWGSWGASGEASVKETSTASREVSQEAEAVRQEEGERLAQRAAQRMVTSETHMFEVSKTVQKEALSKTIATSAQSILSGTATGLGYYQEFKENPEESAKGEKSPLKVAKEIKKKTLPDFEAPIYEFDKKLAEASWNDCLPLQFGLSKVMCDLFCVENSVREGTAAILESLQDSQNVLLENLQALLNYQTEYILWAIGTLAKKDANDTSKNHDARAPEASTLLADLQKIDFEDMAQVQPREILTWHAAAGEQLYSRIAALVVNASKETWPLRLKSARGMLHHFTAAFQQRLRAGAPQESQVAGKLQALRSGVARHRDRATKMQSLHVQMGFKSLSSPLVESFLHVHEKHGTYSMLEMRALELMDSAVVSAQNFSQCDKDSKAMRESWQRAMWAEERSQEALLEAWAATVSGAERLLIALNHEQLLLRLVDFAKEDMDMEPFCADTQRLAQQFYGRAVSLLDRAAWPLVQQAITFQAVASYQEQQLQLKHLQYVPLPEIWQTLKKQLAAVAEPSQPEGLQVAAEALAAMGPELCPAPQSCPRGLQLTQGFEAHGRACQAAAKTVHVMSPRAAAGLVQQLRLRPEPLRSLALLREVEVAVEGRQGAPA